MPGPEANIERFACELFRTQGWLTYKMDQGGGVPDRLFISMKGFHLYLEFKRPGKGTLDPQQVAWAIDMRRRCKQNPFVAIVGPVNSRDQVRAILEEYRYA